MGMEALDILILIGVVGLMLVRDDKPATSSGVRNFLKRVKFRVPKT